MIPPQKLCSIIVVACKFYVTRSVSDNTIAGSLLGGGGCCRDRLGSGDVNTAITVQPSQPSPAQPSPAQPSPSTGAAQTNCCDVNIVNFPLDHQPPADTRAVNEPSRSFTVPRDGPYYTVLLLVENKPEIGTPVCKDHNRQAVLLTKMLSCFQQNMEKALVGAFCGRCETSRRSVG